MNRTKLFKTLRISWTVGWGILAVLLCVLWVRSYRTCDRVSSRLADRTSAIVVSYAGHLSAVFTDLEHLHWTWPKWDSGPVLPNQLTVRPLYDHVSWDDTDLVWPQRPRMGFGWISQTLYMNIPNGEVGWNPQGMTGRSFAADSTGLIMPHWFGVLIFASLAGIPWTLWRWRFSLRTLLIATTLVAVVLGMIVYAVRS